jgi:hypothetical protein
MFERNTAFGFNDGFAFFEEAAVVIEIFGDKVSAVSCNVLFGFSVVGPETDHLLKLGFRVFDMYLMIV